DPRRPVAQHHGHEDEPRIAGEDRRQERERAQPGPQVVQRATRGITMLTHIVGPELVEASDPALVVSLRHGSERYQIPTRGSPPSRLPGQTAGGWASIANAVTSPAAKERSVAAASPRTG